MRPRLARVLAGLCALCWQGCAADASLQEPAGGPRDPEGDETTSESSDDLPGSELIVEVRGEEPVYVELQTPAQLESDGENAPSKWDLQFRSLEIFTNGGASGRGVGAAFGPGDPLDFLFDDVPEVPFLRTDRAGGAFLQWYLYEGAGHSLWSRGHVYGVRSGDDYWKVQILGYYGEVQNAPVSALYQLRYAKVGGGAGADPAAEMVEVANLDATAGGATLDETTPSACLDLQSGERRALSLSEASKRDDWHLCFRRDAISVNNEPSGPGDVVAVDLDAAKTLEESAQSVQALTADSLLPGFQRVDYETLTDPRLEYIRDGVVSAFGRRWFTRDGERIIPSDASWFVRSGDARHYYLVIFRSVSALEGGGYRVEMRVREVK